MIASSVVAGLYAAKFLFWIRKNREVRSMEGLRGGVCGAVVLKSQYRGMLHVKTDNVKYALA